MNFFNNSKGGGEFQIINGLQVIGEGERVGRVFGDQFRSFQLCCVNFL